MIQQEITETDELFALDILLLVATDQMERELLKEFSFFLSHYSIAEITEVIRGFIAEEDKRYKS